MTSRTQKFTDRKWTSSHEEVREDGIKSEPEHMEILEVKMSSSHTARRITQGYGAHAFQERWFMNHIPKLSLTFTLNQEDN